MIRVLGKYMYIHMSLSIYMQYMDSLRLFWLLDNFLRY